MKNKLVHLSTESPNKNVKEIKLFPKVGPLEMTKSEQGHSNKRSSVGFGSKSVVRTSKRMSTMLLKGTVSGTMMIEDLSDTYRNSDAIPGINGSKGAMSITTEFMNGHGSPSLNLKK